MREIGFRSHRLRLSALAIAVAAVLALGNSGAPTQVSLEQSAAAMEQRLLIPGGKAVGIAIETEGVVLVGMSDLGVTASPARLAGLKSGDIITKVNGERIYSADDLSALLTAGESAELSIVRDGRDSTLSIVPVQDARDGKARIGAWVRSGTMGVGTLSYIDPESGSYAALGHPISDVDTGVMLPVADGNIYESRIVRVKKGERGDPGELVGEFLQEDAPLGSVVSNSATGIYGSYAAADVSEFLYPDGLPAATREQLHTGSAQILSEVDDEIRAYDVEIEHIESGHSSDYRTLVIRVTDEALLEKTGGIVQGMSGSPIIQDGRLVGAVTHVFVNDPTRGYGIFIGDMLSRAE